MTSTGFQIVAYRSKAYDYANFSCGNDDMDRWLQQSAGQNERLNRSRTFLLVESAHESRRVCGYFALVNCQVSPEDSALIQGLSYKYPMPATMLTRLAISSELQGQRLGALLLTKAMRRYR